jgi:signal transduction histidine kinase
LKKKIKNILRKVFHIFRGNDIIIRIYLSFVVLLALTVILLGTVFLRLYEKNYTDSYTRILNEQCKVVAKRVGKLARQNKIERFEKYTVDLDELEHAQERDVWIVSNPSADQPLSVDFTNADAYSLESKMTSVLEKAFQGETSSSVNYDDVYGMMILYVATPVYVDTDKTEVSGAVMLVAMLERQQMGVRQGKYLITISAVLALLVSYVVALGFSRYLSKPLRQIGKDIMRLSRGDYQPLQASHPGTQIGRLEMALDKLAGRLRQIVEERANLDQVRRDFFANVSHELRTPITVIRGYAESLADGVVVSEDQVEEYHQRILQECQSMERLVGDLFILSKMQNPDFQMDMEPVSLVQIFSDVVRNGRMLGKEKGISFVLDMPEDDPCLVIGDYDRLRQMFLVITDNAVKFSKENGKIEIGITKIIWEPEQSPEQTPEHVEPGSQLQISIRDYGVGIPPEQLPYIFEKFYTSKLRQNDKGTGLGLMIAKRIAMRHGGDISVESTVGEGTTFYFTLKGCSIEEAENL